MDIWIEHFYFQYKSYFFLDELHFVTNNPPPWLPKVSSRPVLFRNLSSGLVHTSLVLEYSMFRPVSVLDVLITSSPGRPPVWCPRVLFVYGLPSRLYTVFKSDHQELETPST